MSENNLILVRVGNDVECKHPDFWSLGKDALYDGKQRIQCKACGAIFSDDKRKVSIEAEIKIQIINEILGFFRKSNETKEQGNATAIRYLMIIAMEYQRAGALAAMRAMNILNMPARYQTTMIGILEKDCL